MFTTATRLVSALAVVDHALPLAYVDLTFEDQKLIMECALSGEGRVLQWDVGKKAASATKVLSWELRRILPPLAATKRGSMQSREPRVGGFQPWNLDRAAEAGRRTAMQQVRVLRQDNKSEAEE